MKEFEANGPLLEGTAVLEASAGTGKTFSISHTVLRLVAEANVAIDKILVVTFTNPATAELRDRIRGRLRSALAALAGEPGDFDDTLVEFTRAASRATAQDLWRNRIRRALDGFDEAAISTIHGFCQRMLRENAFESRVDFDAELVGDISPLLEELARDLWVAELHTAPESAVRTLQSAGGLGRLLKIVREIAASPRTLLIPPEAPGPTHPADDAWEQAFTQARTAWRQHRQEAVAALVAATPATGKGQRLLDGRVYQAERTRTNAAKLDGLFAGSRPLDPAVPPSLRYFSAARIQEKATGAEFPRHEVFDCCQTLADTWDLRTRALDTWLIGLAHRVARAVRERLPARKREQHVQSFDDLLLHVRDALQADPNSPLARRIRTRYEAALIDEFQDTDPVQWEIFRIAFAGGSNTSNPPPRLILIGDPRQAIYAFRHADLDTYLRARDQADECRRLGRNFRSDEPLLRAVTLLFHRLREPFLHPGIAAPVVEAVHTGTRLSVPGNTIAPLRLRFVPCEGPARPKRGNRINKTWDGFPRLVAADVADFLRRQPRIRRDDGRERALSPRDCAVLVRTHQQAEAIQTALRELNVPGVVHAAGSVFEAHESAELWHVLRAIAEADSGSRMRTAMSTTLIGVNAVGLAALDTDEDEWQHWAERFAAWNLRWRDDGFMAMFRTLLAECDVAPRLLALRDGERRMTNFLHLAELVQSASVRKRLGPAALLVWLGAQRQDSASTEDDRQLRLETDADAVDIVTMHACKGLQYGVVWCPYLWHVRRPSKTLVRYRGPDGPVLDVARTAARESVAAAERQQAGEDLRLAYVALTRARYACSLYWGTFTDGESSALAWLLHGPARGSEPDAGDTDPLRATWQRVAGMSDAQMLAELRAVADTGSGNIEVVEVDPAREGEVWQAPRRHPPALERFVYRRTAPIDRRWRWSSFSALARGAEEPESAELRQEDAEAAGLSSPAIPTTPGAGEAPLPLACLPPGMETGNFIHRVLELHDFQNPDGLEDLVRRQLSEHGMEKLEDAAPVIAAGLATAARTPLRAEGDAFTLADVDLASRFSELAFTFPLACGLEAGATGGLDASGLRHAFAPYERDTLPAEYIASMDGLQIHPAVAGFLRGSIDLVFEHGGVWYLADYKSNNLGDRYEEYRRPALLAEMAKHHYYLQANIYAVALDRYLSWRLGETYDYERQFGGVFYLFVRGMSPATGSESGVYFDRPPLRQMQELSRLFAGNGHGVCDPGRQG